MIENPLITGTITARLLSEAACEAEGYLWRATCTGYRLEGHGDDSDEAIEDLVSQIRRAHQNSRMVLKNPDKLEIDCDVIRVIASLRIGDNPNCTLSDFMQGEDVPNKPEAIVIDEAAEQERLRAECRKNLKCLEGCQRFAGYQTDKHFLGDRVHCNGRGMFHPKDVGDCDKFWPSEEENKLCGTCGRRNSVDVNYDGTKSVDCKKLGIIGLRDKCDHYLNPGEPDDEVKTCDKPCSCEKCEALNKGECTCIELRCCADTMPCASCVHKQSVVFEGLLGGRYNFTVNCDIRGEVIADDEFADNQCESHETERGEIAAKEYVEAMKKEQAEFRRAKEVHE